MSLLNTVRAEQARPEAEVCAIVEATATDSVQASITGISVRVYGGKLSRSKVMPVLSSALTHCLRIAGGAPEGRLIEVRVSQRFPVKDGGK